MEQDRDDYIDTRTDAEIDEAYRRANEADDGAPESDPWWNRPMVGWLVTALLIIGALLAFAALAWNFR